MNLKKVRNYCTAIILLSLSVLSNAKDATLTVDVSRIWTNSINIKKIDGKKPKFFLESLNVAPGEHEIVIEFYYDGNSALGTVSGRTIYVKQKFRALFEAGNTYTWQFDRVNKRLYFNDMGKNFEIPKNGALSTSNAYTDGLVDARSKPKHLVTLLPIQ